MKMQTKFNIGETLYYMDNNKISEFEVYKIEAVIERSDSNIKIKYASAGGNINKLESAVHNTPQDLANSLVAKLSE